MKKGKKSRFGAHNVGADVERRQKAAGGYGYLNLPKDLSLFKEKVGRLKLDIIPYIVSNDSHPDANPDIPDSAHKGNPWYKRPIWVHHRIGVENESVICLKSVGKKCPICEQRDKQFREGMDRDDVTPKAQLRNLYVVIPIGHKDYEEEMHIWEISNGNFQKELDDELEESPEYGVFPDPEEGLTLNIRFSEESFDKNKFAEASRIDFKERDESYDEGIMEEAPNLDEIFTVLSYKELEMKFFELDEEDIDKDEKEGEPEPASKHPFRKRKKIVKEKEEEVDEEESQIGSEAEVEVEEDKPPKRKRKAQSEEECPKGYAFGKDWDEYAECDDCEVFDACGKKNEEAAA